MSQQLCVNIELESTNFKSKVFHVCHKTIHSHAMHIDLRIFYAYANRRCLYSATQRQAYLHKIDPSSVKSSNSFGFKK